MARGVVLIANPTAGRGTFESVSERLSTLLLSRGRIVSIAKTTAEQGSAQRLAAQAASSSDLVIACGGDGTVNEVLQGIAGSRCSLGVLPFGTANALARNIGLPLDPVQALGKLLSYRAQQIPLGQIQNENGSRFFALMAGAGPDGSLAYELGQATKARSGRRAYYTAAARHLLTRRFPLFKVDYRCIDSSVWQSRYATAMMISRIPNLGGPFSVLTKSSRLHEPFLRLQLVAEPARLALAAWFVYGLLRLESYNPYLITERVMECKCIPMSLPDTTYAQVDGEALYPLPVHVSLADSHYWLLLPPNRHVFGAL